MVFPAVTLFAGNVNHTPPGVFGVAAYLEIDIPVGISYLRNMNFCFLFYLFRLIIFKYNFIALNKLCRKQIFRRVVGAGKGSDNLTARVVVQEQFTAFGQMEHVVIYAQCKCSVRFQFEPPYFAAIGQIGPGACIVNTAVYINRYTHTARTGASGSLIHYILITDFIHIGCFKDEFAEIVAYRILKTRRCSSLTDLCCRNCGKC